VNGRALANAGVFGLGIILIVGGGWAIWYGSGYIQLELGWTSVIAGSIAATGGVLTLAVGFVLQRVDALHRVLSRSGGLAETTARPADAFSAEEPAYAPMPLGIESAPLVAHAPEPQPQRAPYVDPALQAAAAINLELLRHEEHSATAAREPEAPGTAHRVITETAASEPPPEVIHAADQGPADDMVKAAAVGDEPELDAAIEELLAEERGSKRTVPAVEFPPAGAEPAMELSDSTPPPPRDALEKTSQRAGGWRGLFSRKDRRGGTPSSGEQTVIYAAPDREEQTAPEPALFAETVLPTPAPAPAPGLQADAIPRTGDDWFDRALSGLDEVPESYEKLAWRSPAETAPREQELARPNVEARLPAQEEGITGSAPPSADPAVMGRYTSGNTTYVMFADGSIEAETPNGVLRFASLADLKVYVEGQ